MHNVARRPTSNLGCCCLTKSGRWVREIGQNWEVLGLDARGDNLTISDVGGGTAHLGVFFSVGMGLPPFVKLVTWWGKVGSTVEILGQGFKGATSVSFNRTPATFKATGDTYLTATVPVGATSGYVTVVTAGGTLTSNQVFQVK